MSDYYDSLEDECDENKCLSDSPKEEETPSADLAVSENESTEKYSFYLSRNVSEEKIKILPNLQISKTSKSNNEKKKFLPEIGNGVNENGAESIRGLFVDNEILSKQGLQLNNDGSFTKSPRNDTEELPFIAQKYKNLQFERKSAHKGEKHSFKKIQKKNMFSFTKKPVNGVSMNQIINARIEKESGEEMSTRRGSSLCVINHLKTDEELSPNDNLTDSMKEKLLQSQRETPLRAMKMASSFKKTNHELNLIKNYEISRRNKFSQNIKEDSDRDEAKSILSKERCLKDSSSRNNRNKKHKSTDSKIFKVQSDVLPNTTIRPKLNYSELRMLKSGYNPLYLRQWSKKVQSDTDRSNFGDSVVEEFPEVSNPASNNENLARDDESEESFYRNLIEMDRNQKRQIQLSTRSESPLEGKNLREKNGSKSYRDQTEMRRSEKGNFKRKHISKTMYIDLSPEVDYSVHTLQKCSHFCSANSSRNVSKVELAQKAKTYGYLANARNIFKLKTQSERRSTLAEKDGNFEISEKLSTTKNTVNLSQADEERKKHNSSPLNVFPSAVEESFKTLGKLPRAAKSFRSIKCLRVAREREEEFVLPPVNNPEVRNSQKKIFK